MLNLRPCLAVWKPFVPDDRYKSSINFVQYNSLMIFFSFFFHVPVHGEMFGHQNGGTGAMHCLFVSSKFCCIVSLRTQQ